jgi:hypothetical protein
MSRDLEQTAANIVAELVCDHDTLDDIEGLRDVISDRAWEAADSAVTYYHWAEEIINEYESHPSADCDSADDCGGDFKPSQYRQAMQVYAHGIAWSVIQSEALSIIDAIEEAADTVREEAARRDVFPDDGDIRVTADCPHGWAAHDSETEDGACLWVSRQLDGCNAVAIKSGPVWLSYTWEPALTEAI